MNKTVYFVTIPFTDGTRMVTSCQLPIIIETLDAVTCLAVQDEQAAVTDIAKSKIETLVTYGDMTEDEAGEYAKELYYQIDASPEESYDVDYTSDYHVFAVTINMGVEHGHQERR